MGILERLEQKIESTVGDGFAKIFGGKIHSQEVNFSLRRQARESTVPIQKNRFLAPHIYTIYISDSDSNSQKFDMSEDSPLIHHLCDDLEKFILGNDWEISNPVVLHVTPTTGLNSGQFRVRAVTPGKENEYYEEQYKQSKNFHQGSQIPDEQPRPLSQWGQIHPDYNYQQPQNPSLNSMDHGSVQTPDPVAQRPLDTPAPQLHTPPPIMQPLTPAPISQSPFTPSQLVNEPVNISQNIVHEPIVNLSTPTNSPEVEELQDFTTVQQTVKVNKPNSYSLKVLGHNSVVYQLKPGNNIIGRGQDSDLKVSDSGVSRNHCKIILTSGVMQIEDLNSTNGTLVNEESISGVVSLNLGDIIKLGHTSLQVDS